MVHPSDPRQPNGGTEQFGETQVGVPHVSGGTPPPPSQAPRPPAAPQFGQPHYPQAQYQQPQYPQPQYQQAQYQQAQNQQAQRPQPGQAPFGGPQQFPPAQQFPPGPYGPGQFAYGPPPKKDRTRLILGIIGVLAVAAIATTLLAVAPWKSGPEEKSATFALGDGVSVDVRLPVGWDASTDNDDDQILIRIHEEDDDRVLTQLLDNLTSLGKTGTGSEMHTVVLFSGKCTTTVSGSEWGTRDRDDSTSRHTERWVYASSKIDDRRCVNLSGVDSATDSVTAGSRARKLVQQLIDEDRVSASKAV